MATIMTHALVGYTIARICVRKPVSPLYWVLVVTAPILPDLDVIAFKHGIPYQDCWGHRGASHSLLIAFVAALILVTLFKVLTRTQGFKVLKDCFWGLFLGISSHGMLDALTNGGLGVAIFWPANCARYFFPIRPLQVSPIGIEHFFEKSFAIMKNEFNYVWIPCLVILFLDYFIQRYSIRNRS